MIYVITPSVNMFGIAANFARGSLAHLLGIGVVPSDRQKMRTWDETGHHDAPRARRATAMTDDDRRARRARHRARAHPRPVRAAQARQLPGRASGGQARRAVRAGRRRARRRSGRTRQPRSASPRRPHRRRHAAHRPDGRHRRRLAQRGQLLCRPRRAPRARSELDDIFVAMHLGLAQQLLYGRGENKATSIVIQLNHYRRHGRARASASTRCSRRRGPVSRCTISPSSPPCTTR